MSEPEMQRIRPTLPESYQAMLDHCHKLSSIDPAVALLVECDYGGLEMQVMMQLVNTRTGVVIIDSIQGNKPTCVILDDVDGYDRVVQNLVYLDEPKVINPSKRYLNVRKDNDQPRSLKETRRNMRKCRTKR